MAQGDTFLTMGIAAFLCVTVLQFLALRRLRRAPGLDRETDHGRPSMWRRGAFYTLSVIALTAGAYFAFGSPITLSPEMQYVLALFYVLWNALLLYRLAGAFALRPRRPAETHGSVQSPADPHAGEAPLADPGLPDLSRRAFLHGVAGISVLSFTGSAFSVSGDEEFEIVHRDLRLPDLPEKLRGLRIAALSDIHSGPFMSRDELKPYVRAVNALRPDIVLLPGDFVQNRNEEIEPVCEVFRGFEAPYGVYGSTGNHDYFADADHISHELELAGVRMLRNEHRVLDLPGGKLALIGLDDVREDHPFDALFRQAVRGLDPRIPNILLCHKPYYLEEASSWGVDFMLSGHTHGGQVVLARLFGVVVTPAALISGYVEGYYSMDATDMYVTRGIGMVGLPIRLNCPPEVTLFTLT